MKTMRRRASKVWQKLSNKRRCCLLGFI